MSRAKPWPELLSDAQVEKVTAGMLALLPPGVAAMLAQSGIDPRDGIRFHAVAARCRAARERRGHSIKMAAAALKVPQYRLKDIESASTTSIDPQVLTRYVAFLGLERWFERWRASAPALAAKLGVPSSGRRRTRDGAAGARAARGARTVLRFRIELQEVRPRVWRSIEVPADYTFWDLHVAIQDAMGWTDSHLHVFELREPATRREVRIGIPDDDLLEDDPTSPGWAIEIAPYFATRGARAEYLYDFGDDWHHDVVCEGSHPAAPRTAYPRCLDGASACPPEDVGGPHGYEAFLAVIADPDHEEHAAMLEWAGGAFDPTRFSPAQVHFDDPRARWRVAFGRR